MTKKKTRNEKAGRGKLKTSTATSLPPLYHCIVSKETVSWQWRLILATQEAKIRKICSKPAPGKFVLNALSQRKKTNTTKKR
jgi:hypothetical protein